MVVFATFGITTVVPPRTAPLSLTRAIVPDAMVTVMSTAEGGATTRLTFTAFCMSSPTRTELPVKPLIVGALTVAVICRKLLGVSKPAGAATCSVVVPWPAGSNARLTVPCPEAKAAGLPTIAPTDGSELETFTVADTPGRRLWLLCNASVPGSRRAEAICTFVFAANVLVLIRLGLLMMKPDGVSVTVLVSVAYPGALAVNWTVPLLSSACRKNGGMAVPLPATESAMLAVPTLVALVDNSSRDGSALVMVNDAPVTGGAATPRLPFTMSCRLRPIVKLPMLIGGALFTVMLAVAGVTPVAVAVSVVDPGVTAAT